MDLLAVVVAGLVGFVTAYAVWRVLSGALSRCLEGLVPKAVAADLGFFVRFAVLASSVATAATRAGFFTSSIRRGGPGAVSVPSSSDVLGNTALSAVAPALSAAVAVFFVFFVSVLVGHVLLKGFQILRSSKEDGRSGPET